MRPGIQRQSRLFRACIGSILVIVLVHWPIILTSHSHQAVLSQSRSDWEVLSSRASFSSIPQSLRSIRILLQLQGRLIEKNCAELSRHVRPLHHIVSSCSNIVLCDIPSMKNSGKCRPSQPVKFTIAQNQKRAEPQARQSQSFPPPASDFIEDSTSRCQHDK
jgi:hypothetical protein